MIWRTVMLTMQLGMVAMMGLAYWQGPSRAPIFDHAQRAPAPGSELAVSTLDDAAGETGDFDWHAGKFSSLFELKEYHLAMARDWLSEAFIARAPSNKQFALRASSHARQALAEGPTNPYAWLYLAWAEKLAGRDEDARAALSASWRWAPYSRNIALSRAQLATQWWPDLEPADRERVLNDVLVAYAVEKKQVRAAIAANPRFHAIWRLARAYRQRLRKAAAESAGQ